MKKKKIVCIMMVLVMSVIGGTAMAAGNITDTKFRFHVDIDGVDGGHFTEARDKRDATSTYIYVQQMMSNMIHCRIWGNQPTSANVRVWADQAIGDPVLRKGEWLVKQLVYEHGCTQAKILFSQLGDYYEVVSGVWSPDSVGSYMYAN